MNGCLLYTSGHPVVALMGPGDFTQNGHFVVLTRLVGKDKVKIADVGSRARTAETEWQGPP